MGTDVPAVLHAYDTQARGGVLRELYNSEQNASRDRTGTALRFNIPTVANARVCVGVKREVAVYGLLSPERPTKKPVARKPPGSR